MQQLEGYKYSVDKRAKSEIQLTTTLARALTELNLKTLNESSPNSNHQSLLDKNFLFVCFCGVPPYKKQFENLQLPGEVVSIQLTGFDGMYSSEELVKIFWETSFQKQVSKVHNILKQKQNRTIIFVFHSFGSYIAHYYMATHPETPIKGIIDLGGAAITMHPKLHETETWVPNAEDDFFVQNSELIYKEHKKILKEWNKKDNVGLLTYGSKEQFIIALKFLKSSVFRQMYEYIRNMPDVFKLICSGGNDNIFVEDLLCEKAIYYSYKKPLPDSYHQKLRQAYQKTYNKKIKNIQERFIYNFQGGAHSFHMQSRFVPTLKNIIHHYLFLLCEVL